MASADRVRISSLTFACICVDLQAFLVRFFKIYYVKNIDTPEDHGKSCSEWLFAVSSVN